MPGLTSIMFRFRQAETILLADIEKALLEIELSTVDRGSKRFYRLHIFTNLFMQATTFSNIPSRDYLLESPCHLPSSHLLWNITFNIHFPPVVEQIEKNAYVCNVQLSAKAAQETIQIYQNAKIIFQDAKTDLRASCLVYVCTVPFPLPGVRQWIQKKYSVKHFDENTWARRKKKQENCLFILKMTFLGKAKTKSRVRRVCDGISRF